MSEPILDFKKAALFASRQPQGTGFIFAGETDLERQAQAAVAREREKRAALVALVKEWQEARLSPDLNADQAERYFKALTALAAFDVEGG